MTDFQHQKEELVAIIKQFNQRGWSPATSTNYSIRENENATTFWVSKSGIDKSKFNSDDLMEVDLDGKPTPQFQGTKPSAETLIHCTMYKIFPKTLAILHSHSLESVCLSSIFGFGKQLTFKGYEVIKAFEGQQTHDTTLKIPVFANSQNMIEFSSTLSEAKKKLENHSFVMRKHGTYAWGNSLSDAKRHIEALEYLIACELRLHPQFT